MFKKLAVTGATAALLFGSALPSFASWNIGVGNGNLVQLNAGGVYNNIGANANSGQNANFAFGAGAQLINTGSATAVNEVSTQLNWNQVNCGCIGSDVNFGLLNGNTAQVNLGHVHNQIDANANSGQNLNAGGLVLLQGTNTGPAVAGSAVVSVVNTNIVGPVLP